MANLGKKYSCYSCQTKFYDLGKPVPLCPKCGADQREAEETPLVTSHRGRRSVEAPLDDDFDSEEETTPRVGTEEEETELVDEPEPEEDEDDSADDY